MRRVVFLVGVVIFLVPGPARAGLLTFTTEVTMSSHQAGTFELTATSSLPLFNPSWGTLNGVVIGCWLSGSASFDVQSPDVEYASWDIHNGSSVSMLAGGVDVGASWADQPAGPFQWGPDACRVILGSGEVAMQLGWSSGDPMLNNFIGPGGGVMPVVFDQYEFPLGRGYSIVSENISASGGASVSYDVITPEPSTLILLPLSALVVVGSLTGKLKERVVLRVADISDGRSDRA